MDTEPKTTKEDLLKAVLTLKAEQEKDEQALAKLQAKKKGKTTSKNKAPEPVPSIEPVAKLEEETEEDLLALQAKLLEEEEEDRKIKEAAIQKVIDAENERKKLQAEKISDEEYAEFVDKNIVSEDRLKILANKVKDKEKLSDKEMAIFTGKTTEINKIIKDIKKGLGSTKTKTPKTPATPRGPAAITPSIGSDSEKQKAEKEALEFLKTFDLGGMVPEGWKDLTEAQKVKVVRDLERIVVDTVKSDAQTQYSEYLKSKMVASIGSDNKWTNILNKIKAGAKNVSISAKEGAKKEFKLKEIEGEVFKELLSKGENKKRIAQDFELLAKVTKDKEIALDANGNPVIAYLNKKELKNWSGGEIKVAEDFEKAANNFHNIPYEWGQGKNKNKYEKAKREYEKAKEQILFIKEEKNKFKPNVGGKAMLEMSEIDEAVKLEQRMNTHPEFQKELLTITESAGYKEYLKTGKGLVSTLSGKNWINRGFMAVGFGARWLTKATAGAVGLGSIMGGVATLGGGMAIGGALGYWRGKFQGKEKLGKREEDVRYEKEKKIITGKLAEEISKVAGELLIAKKAGNIEEVKKLEKTLIALDKQRTASIRSNRETGSTSNITNLTKQLEHAISNIESTRDDLEKAIEKVKNAKDDVKKTKAEAAKARAEERKAEALATLGIRIEHSKGKMEAGQVNFGDARSMASNQLNYVESLNKAIVLKESLKSEIDKAVENDINKLLSLSSGKIGEKVDEAQDAFIKKQMKQAALTGAGFASLGYGIRWLGEQTGLWDWMGEHMPNMPWQKEEQIVIDEVKNTTAPRGSGTEAFDKFAKHISHNKEFSDKIGDVPEATNPNLNTPEPEKVTPPESVVTLDKDAIIGKGEGIEHALRRQIETDEKLAKALGYEGDMSDKGALRAFSGRVAHMEALDKGYVDGKGGEIRINKPGEVAYQFKVDADGKVKILELEVKDGKLIGDQSLEEHATSTKYEGGEGEKTEAYEYRYGQGGEEGTTPPPQVKTDATLDESLTAPKQVDPSTGLPTDNLTAPPQVDPSTMLDDILKAPPQVDPTKSLETTIKAPAQVDPKTGLENKIDTANTPVVEKVLPPIDTGMTPEMTALAQKTYEIQMGQISSSLTEKELINWNFIKGSRTADVLMNMKESETKGIYKPFVAYLHELERVTHLKPISENVALGIKAESNEEYIKRALEFAAKNGKLDEIKMPDVSTTYDNEYYDPDEKKVRGKKGDTIIGGYEDRNRPDYTDSDVYDELAGEKTGGYPKYDSNYNAYMDPENLKTLDGEEAQVYTDNLAKVFNSKAEEAWENAPRDPEVTKKYGPGPDFDAFKKLSLKIPANDYLEFPDIDAEYREPLVKYIQKLHKVTGLEPGVRKIPSYSALDGDALVNHRETADEYIQRALKWATNNGKLDEIKIK